MRYRVIIERQVEGEWKRVHEVVTEMQVTEVAARQIERVITEAGLGIDPRELRNILAEELGE